MQRVMIIGQPGSGKSTLAGQLGDKTFLHVIHIDLIHWTSGWVERAAQEKSAMTLDVIAKPTWIFEGGHSRTWPQRLDRADTLIWLDLPLGLRLRRVLWRTIKHYGRSRPDLPEGCPEQFSAEFLSYIWRTRHTSRANMRALYDGAPADKTKYHLTSPAAVRRFLDGLSDAVAIGNLGIPHR
ncbi:AAA family ATPase [Tateyamaria omphalii]|uniref:AAA family ATPase n=1 Tax=Tateyamaria omphalii TaxID=299262 RepID=A0A1P8MVW7_9RHOB|nr:AAA family ATPase [Tateyamaria omphalii]APX12236.1 AAA family ATPase [Tateyamaria omphalii]